MEQYLSREDAKWWERALEFLLLEKPIITVVAHEFYDWRPEVRQGMVDEILRHDMDYGSWVSIHTTDYGIFCDITDVRVNADHMAVQVKGTAPGGNRYWWVFRVIDEDGIHRDAFRAVERESRRPVERRRPFKCELKAAGGEKA